MVPPDTATVLPAVARLVTEAQTLGDVVARLGQLLRDGTAYNRLYVLRLDRPESVALYTVSESDEMDVTVHRIADAESVAATDVDARSKLVAPVRQGSRVIGVLWLTSDREHAFSQIQQDLIDGIADLLALALVQDSSRGRDALRRERLESLEKLLHTMAESLDIRQIFTDVSDVVQGGLPHDMLVMTSWGEDARSFRVYALAGTQIEDPAFWTPTILTGADGALLQSDAYIVRDAAADIAPGSVRARLYERLGARSALRVPIPLGSGVFGSLLFFSRQLESFGEGDMGFARRVAHHLALALSHQQLADVARRSIEAREMAARLEAQVATLTRELEARTGNQRVIGRSRRWRDVLAHATRVAQTETTVLLTGESGTGKEVIARFVHHGSRRSQGPFSAINCASLPDQLLESELFGYERGAFTGAVSSKPGRIEQANGGVLFLDEVGEMAPSVQAKLLRVLEQREFLRLGGTRTLRADIRVIAATNRDLLAAIRRGQFREDLYYRLGVFEIALPALRERPEDIPELAASFLEEIGGIIGRPAAGLAQDAKDQLAVYAWPGNVRELRNAIERAVILADGGFIHSEHLPVRAPRLAPVPSGSGDGLAALPAGGVSLDAIERSLVSKALTQTRHNKTRAARLLGLTRAQLYSRIEKYGLAETES